MMDVDYLRRAALSRGTGHDYRLVYYSHTTQDVRGQITYVFRDGKESLMSDGDVTTTRGAWHRQCRLNRARRAGRPYRHIIENRRIKQP
jgi:hypothetical protein